MQQIKATELTEKAKRILAKMKADKQNGPTVSPADKKTIKKIQALIQNEKQIISAGGIRAGAGRKSQYGEPTVSVGFKVPESRVLAFKEEANKLLLLWKIK